MSSLEGTAKALLTAAGKSADDVRLWLITENHNRLYEAVRNHLEIPVEKTHPVSRDFGNTQSAMLPLQLAFAMERGKCSEGDLVMMLSVGEGIQGGGVLLAL